LLIESVLVVGSYCLSTDEVFRVIHSFIQYSRRFTTVGAKSMIPINDELAIQMEQFSIEKIHSRWH